MATFRGPHAAGVTGVTMLDRKPNLNLRAFKTKAAFMSEAPARPQSPSEGMHAVRDGRHRWPSSEWLESDSSHRFRQHQIPVRSGVSGQSVQANHLVAARTKTLAGALGATRGALGRAASIFALSACSSL